MIMAQNLEELAQVEISDSLAWVSAMKKMVELEEDVGALSKAIKRVKDLTRKEVIERELGEKLIQPVGCSNNHSNLNFRGGPGYPFRRTGQPGPGLNLRKEKIMAKEIIFQSPGLTKGWDTLKAGDYLYYFDTANDYAKKYHLDLSKDGPIGRDDNPDLVYEV